MLLKVGLPVAAAAMLGMAAVHMRLAQRTPPPTPPLVEPTRNPFVHCVSGSGVVEARTENIAVGSPHEGLVAEVHAKVDQQVKSGDPLFRLDDRNLKAEWRSRRAAVDVARARLAQLESGPRAEAIPVKEAKLREAEALLGKQEDLLERARRLQQRLANSAEELTHRQFDHQAAKEQVAQAKADLDLLKAGAWEPDKALARAQLAEAEALAEQAQTELDRLTVRAPIEGRILKVNVRVGERVGVHELTPPMVMGDLEQLHVRVDIDEADVPRLDTQAPARAFVKGVPDEPFSLSFVRLEPEVVQKRALNGSPDERVDTRVLQVIYRVEGRARRLFVGQQMDVFIEAAPQK